MAARFFVVGGVDTNWSTIGNWSLTSGGAGGQTVPLATDDVTLDGNSGSACVLNTSARVAKTLTINGYTGSLTFDQQLSVSGSITFTTTGFTFAGAVTNKLRMIAAGTWTTNGKTIAQNVEIGGTTTFTCTLADALTVPILTLTNTTSTIFSGNFLTTADSCTISGSQTITIVADVQINGTTTIADANLINGAGKNWKLGGDLTLTGTLGGTALVLVNGTCTVTGSAQFASPFTINTAGTFTLAGTLNLTANNQTITYIAGTMTLTGSTLVYATNAGSLVFDTAGVTWPAISVPGTSSSTFTINSLLSIGTFTGGNGAMTFAGSFGWTVANWTNTSITATRVYTLAAGVTYTITGSFVTVHASAQTNRFTLKSSTPGTKAMLILGPGATQDIGFMDPTDIDSSLGQIVFSYHGVLSNTLNWATAFLINAGRVRSSYQMVA